MIPARRAQGFGTTVFSEFSALALRHGAVNLGQGFPDFDGPADIRDAALRAIAEGRNQYALGPGAPELRQAIAAHAQRFHAQKVDADSMVTVTSGATEAIHDAILALVDPGDEVVMFEPAYDSYTACVQLAGGVSIGVLLRPPDDKHEHFWFDPGELEAAFSERTKVILVNTPHNPTGKVFTHAELALIAELCRKHDVVAISDEVYEHLVFAPARHVRLATLPGMEERTVTLSSAGKSFGFTGWKIGWAVAAPPLRAAVQAVHQWVTFATATPLQHAVAQALLLPDAYFAKYQADYARRRDTLVSALRDAGLRPYVPEGTYFVLADFSGVPGAPEGDIAFCRWLTAEVGVAAIPPSAFYAAERRQHARTLARFAFCKSDAVLDEAARRLRAMRR